MTFGFRDDPVERPLVSLQHTEGRNRFIIGILSTKEVDALLANPVLVHLRDLLLRVTLVQLRVDLSIWVHHEATFMEGDPFTIDAWVLRNIGGLPFV